MTLGAGTRLGSYEILGPLGAGGMGEVYRAKDARLAREVAIKVLPEEFFESEERRQRFEREARLLAALNHPGIAAIYSFEEIPGSSLSPPSASTFHILVQELLEGETLRSALAGGRLSQRKAIDYALQIAHGLAAAHEKGIVHRDLKPENLFVTKDGRLKILDFGLAKLTHQEEGGHATNLPTASGGTEPGVVMGTLGYMSPEQVKGKPADPRSDIFSFGTILYELLAGKRAFHGDSAAETISAILREDPPELSVTNQSVSPGLERIVRHCIEKNPEQRFHSAHDLAFDLETLSGLSGASVGSKAAALGKPAPRIGRLWLAGTRCRCSRGRDLRRPHDLEEESGPPSIVQEAHVRPRTRSIRALCSGRTDDRVRGVLGWRPETSALHRAGGKPRVAPAGASTGPGRVHLEQGRDARLEFSSVFDGIREDRHAFPDVPVRAARRGTCSRTWAMRPGLPTAAQWRSSARRSGVTDWSFPQAKFCTRRLARSAIPRISPKGDAVAFLDHPLFGDDRGSVAIVDRCRKEDDALDRMGKRTGDLLVGLRRRDLVQRDARRARSRALYAVTPSGRLRPVATTPCRLTLQDISRDGRVLFVEEQRTARISRPSFPGRRRNGTSRGWSGPTAPILSGGREARWSSPSKAKREVRGTPCTCERSTDRRR